MGVKFYHGIDAVPPEYATLFSDGRGGDIFYSRAWVENHARSGVTPGDRLRFFGVEPDGGGTPMALLPALYSRLYAVHPRSRVVHFLQPDGLLYAPLAGTGEPDPAVVISEVIESLQEDRRAYDVLRASPLERESRLARALVGVLRRTRHPLQIYRQFMDRYVVTESLSSREYLRQRPPAVREALDGAGRMLYDSGRAGFRLCSDPGSVEAGWEAYRTVLAACGLQSDLAPLPYLHGILRLGAGLGALRQGILDLDGTPAAVQVWIVSAGVARCLRIWSDGRARTFPLDEMLTARLSAHLIDSDGVAELDFGAVQEEFARDWAPAGRARLGIVAFNPRTWRGLKGALRHVGAEKLRSIPHRISRRLGGGRAAHVEGSHQRGDA